MERPVLTIAGVVKYARLRQNLSAKEVSRRAGLSPSYVSKVESGECEPSVCSFGAIAMVLGLTPHEVWVAVIAEAATKLSHPESMIDA